MVKAYSSMMFDYCSTPAQFQLPAGFQQLPDSMPIKQEPQEPQPVLDLQPPAKAKAKKKKIKKEPQDKWEMDKDRPWHMSVWNC